MAISVNIFLLNISSYEKHNLIYDKNGNPEKTDPEFVHGINLLEMDLMKKMIIDKFPQDFDIEFSVHFVDPNYKINHYYTDEGKVYYNKLNSIKTGKESMFYSFHDVSWNNLKNDFYITDEDIYYFMSTDDFVNDYDFFNYLEIKITNNVFVNYNIKSLKDIKDARNPYNIFGTELVEKSLDFFENKVSYNENSVRWMTENGVKHCILLKEALVHKKERYIQSNLPPWCLNVESHYMKGIILEYEIFPERKIILNEKLCIGKTIQEKFLESAQYRAIILDYMIRKLIFLNIFLPGKFNEITDPYEFNLNFILE